MIHLKQNRLMRNFRAAGATSPATARTPEDIGCRQVACGGFNGAKLGSLSDSYAGGDARERRESRCPNGSPP